MREKKARDRLIGWARQFDWVLGFEDETRWSRLAQPNPHAWTAAEQTLRLVELARAKDDPDRKALACYGLLVRWDLTQTEPQEQIVAALR